MKKGREIYILKEGKFSRMCDIIENIYRSITNGYIDLNEIYSYYTGYDKLEQFIEEFKSYDDTNCKFLLSEFICIYDQKSESFQKSVMNKQNENSLIDITKDEIIETLIYFRKKIYYLKSKIKFEQQCELFTKRNYNIHLYIEANSIHSQYSQIIYDFNDEKLKLKHLTDQTDDINIDKNYMLNIHIEEKITNKNDLYDIKIELVKKDGEGYIYQQSRSWDMDISLAELFNYNKECLVDRNYKPHKLDECYRGYCMYLKHPTSDRNSIMIGIHEDGFTYIGDGSPDKEYPSEPTIEVAKEMILYRDWVNKREMNEHKSKYYLLD